MQIIDILIIIVALAIISLVLYDLLEKPIKRRAEESKKEKERFAEEKAQEIARHEALLKKRDDDYLAAYTGLIQEYGEVTTSFLLGQDEKQTEDYLYVFEQTSTISLLGEIVPFNKIIGFSLEDDTETIIKNEASYHSVTKTKTGNMLGRAVVGGILLGEVGALAGAATSKKTTDTVPTINESSSRIKHNYTLYLSIDDLSNPIRVIFVGSDSRKAQTLANVFNIIVQRNK